MQLRTVLFDLDGTLIDHLKAIHRSYRHALLAMGLPVPTMDEVRHAIGGGLETAMLRFVPQTRLEEALALYRQCWSRTMLDDVELLPGARELLADLKAHGIACAVFTNKHGPSSRQICDHLGITPLLSGVFGAQDTPWLKPQPEYAAHVLGALGAEPATTMLVGDSPFDVNAARQGGLAACWCVTTGTHGEAELRAAGADRIFPNLTQLHLALNQAKRLD